MWSEEMSLLRLNPIHQGAIPNTMIKTLATLVGGRLKIAQPNCELCPPP
jgi:hypothetical protein